mmetsp:Transcript_30585/g.76042  ORF Transcript_30585/g.76042 Transcript_30585/m.76042 type:complete len:248 (+) Transcript_30585:1248-1991(+)
MLSPVEPALSVSSWYPTSTRTRGRARAMSAMSVLVLKPSSMVSAYGAVPPVEVDCRYVAFQDGMAGAPVYAEGGTVMRMPGMSLLVTMHGASSLRRKVLPAASEVYPCWIVVFRGANASTMLSSVARIWILIGIIQFTFVRFTLSELGVNSCSVPPVSLNSTRSARSARTVKFIGSVLGWESIIMAYAVSTPPSTIWMPAVGRLEVRPGNSSSTTSGIGGGLGAPGGGDGGGDGDLARVMVSKSPLL